MSQLSSFMLIIMFILNPGSFLYFPGAVLIES